MWLQWQTHWVSFNNITGINNVGEMSSTSNPHASLIHIEMKVKEQLVMAMVDTGATHTFIDVKIATKLGLKLSKSPSYVYVNWKLGGKT